MLWMIQELIVAAEEFRSVVSKYMDKEWAANLPMAQLTQEEVKTLVGTQMARDELTALSQLAQLGSVSAALIAKPQPGCDIVKEAADTLAHMELPKSRRRKY